jgi:hypothetical protein
VEGIKHNICEFNFSGLEKVVGLNTRWKNKPAAHVPLVSKGISVALHTDGSPAFWRFAPGVRPSSSTKNQNPNAAPYRFPVANGHKGFCRDVSIPQESPWTAPWPILTDISVVLVNTALGF